MRAVASTAVPHLGLLGGFRLTVGSHPVALPPAAQRVVAYLALHGRVLARDHLAGALWADLSSARAAANLRAALWRAAVPDTVVLVPSRTHVRLADDLVVDHEAALDRARRLVHGLGADPAAVADELAGDLLPGWDLEWVLPERERVRQLRLHARDALCDRLATTGHGAQAVLVGRACVADEPLRESAHRCLIRAYLAQGDVPAALRQYEHLGVLLAAELGAVPSPLAQELVRGLPRPRRP